MIRKFVLTEDLNLHGCVLNPLLGVLSGVKGKDVLSLLFTGNSIILLHLSLAPQIKSSLSIVFIEILGGQRGMLCFGVVFLSSSGNNR